MASILKVDQLQSDSGTVNLASNLAFTGASTFVGNIANPTITGTLNLTGGGIKFPASQVSSADGNTLDDYEEGTWTPTYTGWSTAGTTTYTNQTGRYTKVGRLVTLNCYVSGSLSGGSTDYFSIGGFPFTVLAGAASESGGIVSYLTGLNMGSGGRGWWLYPATNTTRSLGGMFTQTAVTTVDPNVSFNAYVTVIYFTS